MPDVVPFSVVYSIPEPRGVHDGELQFDAFLFYIHGVFGDFYCLRDSLWGEDTNCVLISASTYCSANIYQTKQKKKNPHLQR